MRVNIDMGSGTYHFWGVRPVWTFVIFAIVEKRGYTQDTEFLKHQSTHSNLIPKYCTFGRASTVTVQCVCVFIASNSQPLFCHYNDI